jgi:outer membrane protein assembly factor BamA
MMRGLFRGLGVATCLLLWSGALRAQEKPNNSPWKDSFYPVLTTLDNDFPLLVIHFEERKANRPDEWYPRTPYAGLLALDAGASTAGSRFATVRFHAPTLRHDWRLLGTLTASRAARFGYFGLGNDTDFDDNNVSKSQPFFYRAKRVRYIGQVEVSRRVAGPLWVALAGGVEHSVLSDLPLPSVFRTEQGSSNITDTDTRGRLSLVYDSRDNEFVATRGIFAQTSLTLGSGGKGYSRISADLRGFVSVREGTVLAARIAGSGMSTDAPLNARFEIPEWENDVPVLGGTYSNRGLAFQRLAGRGVLFANAEVRHDLLNLGDFGAFTAFGFVDAGRVFETEDFSLTTKDMKVGAGGGLAVRLLRFIVWTFNFAGGPDGFQFSSGSGWAF